MRKSLVTTVVGALLLSAVAIMGVAGPASAAASAPTQGVTATTIRVGIPYVDLAAVRQFGITLDQGSFPDAYNAIIANLNAQGGINGRKLVPYLVGGEPGGNGTGHHRLHPVVRGRQRLRRHQPSTVRLLPAAAPRPHDFWNLPGLAVHERDTQLHPAAASGRVRPGAAGRAGAPR